MKNISTHTWKKSKYIYTYMEKKEIYLHIHGKEEIYLHTHGKEEIYLHIHGKKDFYNTSTCTTLSIIGQSFGNKPSQICKKLL